MIYDPLDPFIEMYARGQLFRRHGGGRGGVSRQQSEATVAELLEQEAEEEFKKNDVVQDPPPPPKPKARLFNPQWGGDRGCYNEKMTVSVEGELPPEIAHLTRVTFTVHAIRNGELDRIGAKDAHLKDGKAMAELILWTPRFTDANGNPVQYCEYSFKAKHRDSPEIESENLRAFQKGVDTTPPDLESPNFAPPDFTPPEIDLPQLGIELAGDLAIGSLIPENILPETKPTSPYYLRIHMNPEEAKKLEEKFILTSVDGSYTQTRTAEDDLILGDDFIDLRFTEVPTALIYSLRIEAGKSRTYHVFQNVPFSKLDGFVE